MAEDLNLPADALKQEETLEATLQVAIAEVRRVGDALKAVSASALKHLEAPGGCIGCALKSCIDRGGGIVGKILVG